MNKLLLTLSFLISLICVSSQGVALPNCNKQANVWNNCYAVYTWKNGDYYEGDWKNNKMHGNGSFVVGNLGDQGTNAGDKFVGAFKNGKRDGFATYYYLGDNEFKGDIYEGNYKQNKKNGYGTYYYLADNSSKGDIYKGQFKDNLLHGKGTYSWASGAKYIGEYKGDKRNGYGKYTFKDGTFKEGIWKDGKFQYSQKKSTPTSNPKIEEYKSLCSEIGFTPGTEKYGECVVEAMKKG